MPTRLTPDTASLPNEALPAVLNDDAFWPYEPKSLEESGLSDMALESIVLQTFLAVGTLTGRGMTDRVKLPFRIIEQLLAQLRVRQLIAHARPAPLNDFYYSLTEAGQKRAVHYQSICSYTGPAPVPLMDYVLSVEAQASTFEPITRKQLLASFENVTFEQSWLDFIGPAINSNSGIFLYGPPGNGKTTLAKCLAACRGEEIWIPHAIIEDGIIIKFFDAAYHQPIKHSVGHSGIVTDQEHDRRWIRVRRPTVVVGGELTMDHLEIRHDERSNTCEAPLQMRSNCGCLLIDDFGRQRMEPAELLNRWIIPLENRHDYLSLPTGKKFCVPFEQIILFSTNLQPESLVDEAFLRRVPFKIHIGDPTAEEFTELFRMTCESFDVQWRPEVVEELMLRFYRKTGRALRRCHPRDLLHQIRCLCAYRGERMELRSDYLDIACKNYFGNKVIVSEDAPPRYAGKNMGSSVPPMELSPLPMADGVEVAGIRGPSVSSPQDSGTYVVSKPLHPSSFSDSPSRETADGLPNSSQTVYNPSAISRSQLSEHSSSPKKVGDLTDGKSELENGHASAFIHAPDYDQPSSNISSQTPIQSSSLRGTQVGQNFGTQPLSQPFRPTANQASGELGRSVAPIQRPNSSPASFEGLNAQATQVNQVGITSQPTINRSTLDKTSFDRAQVDQENGSANAPKNSESFNATLTARRPTTAPLATKSKLSETQTEVLGPDGILNKLEESTNVVSRELERIRSGWNEDTEDKREEDRRTEDRGNEYAGVKASPISSKPASTNNSSSIDSSLVDPASNIQQQPPGLGPSTVRSKLPGASLFDAKRLMNSIRDRGAKELPVDNPPRAPLTTPVTKPELPTVPTSPLSDRS